MSPIRCGPFLAALAWLGLTLFAAQALAERPARAAKPKTKPVTVNKPVVETATLEKPTLAKTDAPDSSLRDVLSRLATAEEVPAELRDPAFDRFVDLSLLGTAWAHVDAGAMADVALQLVEAERILDRPHKALAARDLLPIALRLAAIQHDGAALNRVAKAAKSHPEAVAAARKLFAETPADDPALTISIAALTPEMFTYYKGCLQDITAARVVQDPAMLEAVEKDLAQMTGLPAEHRGKLEAKVADAKKDLPAGAKEGLAAASILDKLAGTTRSPHATVPSLLSMTRPPSHHPPTFRPPTITWPPLTQHPPRTPPPNYPPPRYPPPNYPPPSHPPTWTPPETFEWPQPPTVTSKYPQQQQQQQQQWIPSKPSMPSKGKQGGGGYYPYPEEEQEPMPQPGATSFSRRYGW